MANASQLQIRLEKDILVMRGELTIEHLADAESQLAALSLPKLKEVDITALTALDTAGAYIVQKLNAPIRYGNESHKHLLELVTGLDIGELPKKHPLPAWQQSIIDLGKSVIHMRDESKRVITFAGKSAVLLTRALAHPRNLRIGAIAQQINAIGIQALPIIGLMAFFISVVLAYQGVAQLRPYGGEQFTVNLVALSILREMGVLLTAIMIAGRSGSAFTAEIGVMKAREEVDALQVMGLDPFNMLVIPRLIAITIALPLLTFYANIMGLAGGFIICHSLIDITLSQYIERVHLAASGSDLFVGLIKAPVFAFVIGIVGCMHGLRVTGSAESVGRETTLAVVKSIFLVLVLDAFFSVFFEEVGL